MDIVHFFDTRKVEMSDNSDIFELVTPDGERVASASTEGPLHDLEIALNLAITDAIEANSDITEG
jgi:hypothetical protein